ncbi:MAG TPA: hypothetical protein V6D47_00790 [Oscillatoriaceae cyanobacterium]
MSTEFHVSGLPVTFATKLESRWKATIREQLAEIQIEPAIAVALDFTLLSMARAGHPFDLDNLCEPVLSELSGAGWFRGKRPGLRQWSATKRLGPDTGVSIRLGSTAPSDSNAAPNHLYKGKLPRKGTDPTFIEWVERHLARQLDLRASDSVGLALQFGSSRLNIGDIATGRVKNVIDCLFPVIGGTAGAPNDWKFDALYVKKEVEGLGEDGLSIAIWPLE